MQHMQKQERLRRACRTFLLTACGMLTALAAAALLGWFPEISGWRAALLLLTASAVSAGMTLQTDSGGE